MAELSKVKITEKVKDLKIKPIEIESNAYIVLVDGWRIRVYFEEGHEIKNGEIDVQYTGNIKNIHTVKFLTLK